MHRRVLAKHFGQPREMSCFPSPYSPFLFLLHLMCKPSYVLYVSKDKKNLAYQCQHRGNTGFLNRT